MDVSGDVADLMVKESIQLTEASIKLLAAGSKNLAAFLWALSKDNKKLVGKTHMARLLREGKELKVFRIKESDLAEFRAFAKKNVLFAAVKDSRAEDGMVDLVTNVDFGGCTTITWPNAALRGQIQIIKKSAEYNSVNGLPAGTLLEGATFEIYNERNGALVDTIVSDNRGLAVSKPLPLGRYTIRETKAPANYSANGADITAVLEYSGQIVKFEVTNKSANTGISISKTGPKEAVGGQPVRYVFSKIGNTGNVTLQSFYWRDTLPAAVTLDKVVTGTYNRPGNYKIVYKVNNTGDYRTLADNLSTSQNYTLAASPVALGLAANERVTEIMFIFGQAPGGFGQVEAPMLYCTAVKGLTAGSSFVNVADVGGVYNGAWVQAVTRWVTTVYGKPTPLPRTGY